MVVTLHGLGMTPRRRRRRGGGLRPSVPKTSPLNLSPPPSPQPMRKKRHFMPLTFTARRWQGRRISWRFMPPAKHSQKRTGAQTSLTAHTPPTTSCTSHSFSPPPPPTSQLPHEMRSRRRKTPAGPEAADRSSPSRPLSALARSPFRAHPPTPCRDPSAFPQYPWHANLSYVG